MNSYKKLLKEYIKLILREVDWEKFSTSSDNNQDPVSNAAAAMFADPSGRLAIAREREKRGSGVQAVLEANKEALRAKKGIDIQTLQRVGEGDKGIAFSLGEEKILKITRDAGEARSSNIIKGMKLKGITHIYDVWKFPDSNLYGIVLEKVIPFQNWPDDSLKHSIEEIVDTFNLKQLIQKYHGNWKEIWEKEINNSPLIMKTTDKGELQIAFQTLTGIIDNLNSYGISFFDAHLGNIGKRESTGEIVLFDLGFNTKGGKEPPVL